MEEPDEGSRRGPIAALVVIVLLVLGTLWLTGQLRRTGEVQDCAMAGRRDCAPVGK